MKSFAQYAKQNWLNVRQDSAGRWYTTRDHRWTLEQMAKEGWSVASTGETELCEDDTIIAFFTVAQC